MTIEDADFAYNEIEDFVPAIDSDEHFIVHKDRKSWSGAKASCESYGRTLAVIHSAEEEQLLINQLDDGWYWIGLSETCRLGTYAWTDGSALDYTNWAWG